jgi:uncharacterized membrane protein
MDPTLVIAFWAVLFVASHLVISSNAVRPVLVGKLGPQPYRGIYSLVALVTFVPLLIAFAHHKHAGPMLWYLRGILPIRWLVWLMMLAAFIFLVGAFVNPSPGAIGAPSNRPPGGILKISRHPFFVAVAIFAFAHLLMNGWAGDVFFFGSLAALAIIGGWHQDQRKLAELGAPYRALVDSTSFMPFAAIVRGRQAWTGADIPWIPIALGAVAAFVVLMFHPMLFGGNPLG